MEKMENKTDISVPSEELLKTDGHCALCGKMATFVCHCPECQDACEYDGDDPDDGRPMCSECLRG